MKAIVLRAPNDFGMQEIENPVLGPDDLEIKVRLAGICGTDLNMVRGRMPNLCYPIVPGHEYVGEVLRAPDFSSFQIGQRVTVFPAMGCGICAPCKAGRIPHCPEAKTFGVARPGGCFAERAAAHQNRVFLLPEGMLDSIGVMIEPTAVAVHANRRAQVEKGIKAVVIGGGSIGLLIAQVARAYGACPVIVSEPIEERRALAQKMGFDLTCNPRQTDLASWVRTQIGMADVVFDVVGSRKTLWDGEEMLRPDGALILVASPHDAELGIPYPGVYQKELRILGTRTYFLADFPEAISLLSTRRVLVEPMLDKILPLDRFPEGVELLEKQPNRHFKILISPLL